MRNKLLIENPPICEHKRTARRNLPLLLDTTRGEAVGGALCKGYPTHLKLGTDLSTNANEASRGCMSIQVYTLVRGAANYLGSFAAQPRSEPSAVGQSKKIRAQFGRVHSRIPTVSRARTEVNKLSSVSTENTYVN